MPKYGRKQFPKLRSLFFDDNQLTGPLPKKWIGLTDLQTVDVGYNAIMGSIPSLYGDALHRLRDFNVCGNSITGSIPTELLSLTNLDSLILCENHLNSTIPGGWSQLKKLQYLHLNDNYLSGTIPPDLFVGAGQSLFRYG